MFSHCRVFIAHSFLVYDFTSFLQLIKNVRSVCVTVGKSLREFMSRVHVLRPPAPSPAPRRWARRAPPGSPIAPPYPFHLAPQLCSRCIVKGRPIIHRPPQRQSNHKYPRHLDRGLSSHLSRHPNQNRCHHLQPSYVLYKPRYQVAVHQK